MSPYPFKTAKEHYEAMLADATARGGPTVYDQAALPNWNGTYSRESGKLATWYHGNVVQIPTYLTLLTPEYQTRFVQQMYHYAVSNAPQWPASYCQPEGFMRRFAQYSRVFAVGDDDARSRADLERDCEELHHPYPDRAAFR